MMNELNQSDDVLGKVLRVMLGTLVLGLVGLFLVLSQTPLGSVWNRMFDSVFGVSSGHMTWFITRSSGILAYLLLWLSTIWGLAVSSKMFDKLVPRAFTYDSHEYISLLALVFTAVHVFILLGEKYMPFNVPQLFIPFISDYRPFWIGIGIIGTYLTLLVTATFYMRKWIGQRAFRVIHYLSFAGFFGVLIHSWFSGTDTGLEATRIMYLSTGLSVIFMTVYWLVMMRLQKKSTPVESEPLVLQPLTNQGSVTYMPRQAKRDNPFLK
jgi:predicted ferric reductase